MSKEHGRIGEKNKQVPKIPTFSMKDMKGCFAIFTSTFPRESQTFLIHGRRAECDAASAALALHLSPIPGPPLRPHGDGVPSQDSVDGGADALNKLVVTDHFGPMLGETASLWVTKERETTTLKMPQLAGSRVPIQFSPEFRPS